MQPQDNQPPGNNEATLIAPRAQQGVARLILRRPDGQLQEYGLDKDEFTIGRLSTGDIVLQDDRSVSRRHAVIRRSNAGYVIEDLQSNNGTYVDGERIQYPFVLRNGQSIKVGDHELTFKIISAPLAAAPSSGPAAGGMPAQMPAEAPGPTYDLPVPGMGQAPAPQAFNPPAFDAQPQPAFGAPQQQPAFGTPPPAFGMPPEPAFGGPPPQPAFNAPQPLFGSPPQPVPGGPPALFGQPPTPDAPPPFGAPPGAAPFAPPAPAPSGPASASGPSGMITCQVCNQQTQANKAFCLNCGSSLLAQQQQQPATPSGPPPPFGGPPAPGGFAPNQFNQPPDAPPAWQPPAPPGQPLGGPPGPPPFGGPPPGQPPFGGPPGPQFGGPPPGQPLGGPPGPQFGGPPPFGGGGPPPGQPFGGPPGPQFGGPPPGQPFGGPPPGPPPFGGPPPGQPFGGPPPGPPPFGGPPPGPPPFGGPPPQGQFAPPGAAPGIPQGGPVEALAFYQRGMRPMQPSDIIVRLTTNFPAPGPLQPGMQVSVRIWPAAPDALFLSGPGVTLSVPAPGQVQEASIKVTPLRETPRGLTDQILFQLNDATTGQPIQPTPAFAEVVISQQPVPQFDGPGSIRLML